MTFSLFSHYTLGSAYLIYGHLLKKERVRGVFSDETVYPIIEIIVGVFPYVTCCHEGCLFCGWDTKNQYSRFHLDCLFWLSCTAYFTCQTLAANWYRSSTWLSGSWQTNPSSLGLLDRTSVLFHAIDNFLKDCIVSWINHTIR